MKTLSLVTFTVSSWMLFIGIINNQPAPVMLGLLMLSLSILSIIFFNIEKQIFDLEPEVKEPVVSPEEQRLFDQLLNQKETQK